MNLYAEALPAAGRDVKAEPVLIAPVCLALGILLTALKVAPGVMPLVMLGLAVYALRGPKEGIEALSVLFLVLNLNPAVFPVGGRGLSLRWLVLFAVFGRVVWDGVLGGKRWPVRLLALLGLYAGVVGVLSVGFSRIPVISVFKIVAFTIGAAGVLTSFHRTVHLKAYWESWFTTLFLFVFCMSLPLYGSPAGYFINGRGFQGILVHPQTYGPIAAPWTAWLVARVYWGRYEGMLYKAGIALGMLAMITSQARTSLLMFLGSLICMFGVAWLRGHTLIPRERRTGFPGMKLIGLVLVCIVLTLKGAAVQDALTQFVLKNHGDAGSASFDARTSLVEEQLANFYSAPLSGIGFGVPSNAGAYVRSSAGFMGMPTGFSVEKGFLPSAVLEETGVIGAIVVLVLMAGVIGPILRSGSLPNVALLTACMLANAGEMVFFSFGGMGLYFWLLMGYCHSSPGSGVRRPVYEVH